MLLALRLYPAKSVVNVGFCPAYHLSDLAVTGQSPANKLDPVFLCGHFSLHAYIPPFFATLPLFRPDE